MTKTLTRTAFILLICLLPVRAGAQDLDLYRSPQPASPRAEASRPADAETFGTGAANYTWVSNEQFRPFDSATTWNYDVVPNDHYLYRAANVGSGLFSARLNLDNGVVINSIRFYFKDASATTNAGFFLTKMQVDLDTGANPAATILANVGSAGTPGYATANVPVNVTYLNTEPGRDNRWIIVVNLPFDGTNVAFGGARVMWTRQVSPAPATATFADVPTTHVFYQYIEALSAAGVTAGCGGGNFCPDASITRGQMAVVISKALGLHFAP